jgi:hypothetical protein
MRHVGCPTSPASPGQSSAALYAEGVLQRCQAHLVFVEHVIHPHTCCAAGLSRQNIARRRCDFPQDNMRTNLEGSLTKSATQRPTLSMHTEPGPSPAWTLSTPSSNRVALYGFGS